MNSAVRHAVQGRTDTPRLSVVVPAHDAASSISHALGAILASDLPGHDLELIVVDDASTDMTAAIARKSTDRVVQLRGEPRGPAFARNRGFEAASADIIAFVDADVCVHPDALRRCIGHFRDDPSLAAVFGSYDDRPSDPAFVSQYRNLLHHYVHQRGGGPTGSFWAGCGAVRRQPFCEAGMFDETTYARPAIEDVELGYRLHARGHRLLLDPLIQGTHRKSWTLITMLRADFLHRGVPWTRLLLSRRAMLAGGGLSVGSGDKLSTALVALFAASAFGATVLGHLIAGAVALTCLLLFFILNRDLIGWFRRKRGVFFAARAFGMHLLYHANNVASVTYGTATYFLRPSRA